MVRHYHASSSPRSPPCPRSTRSKTSMPQSFILTKFIVQSDSYAGHNSFQRSSNPTASPGTAIGIFAALSIYIEVWSPSLHRNLEFVGVWDGFLDVRRPRPGLGDLWTDVCNVSKLLKLMLEQSFRKHHTNKLFRMLSSFSLSQPSSHFAAALSSGK